MKRLIICLLLFAFVLTTAAVSSNSVKTNVNALLTSIEATAKHLNGKEMKKAALQAEETEKLWKSNSLAFFVFLDHTTFSELDVLMPMLSAFVRQDPKTAKEQIFRCEGILNDIAAHQRVSAGNIL